MGGAQTIWNALTTIIQMEGRVTQQAQLLTAQQARIETLTERVIRLETQMEMLLIGAGAKSPSKRLR
ncbi:MAG: hypothetical protein M0P72_11720 [Metallibacterium scheffleri]|jgi:hypothetical protein|uniref:hypothetical protein n=1 Tax=Metallibacterium scheffleri TaxID=993689 RepID=UPI0026EAA8B5|nr:hypothetical protein [Metallibacterium scheffleri]MCK9367801.1 hypothetical protein [Metallibacterium scheffleri]